MIHFEDYLLTIAFFPFQEGILLLSFSDLRQLLDLFVSWDWSTYLADYGNSSSKYIRVKPESAIVLLDKLKECEKKSNAFGLTTLMNKKERDKKRLVDTVYAKIKALTQQQQQLSSNHVQSSGS